MTDNLDSDVTLTGNAVPWDRVQLAKNAIFTLDYEPKYTSHKSSRNTKRPNSRRQVLPTWNSVSGQLHSYHNLADYLQKKVVTCQMESATI
ncbi:hypothetical protein ACUKBL_12080 [Furfurilactobacillus rossiae]